MLRLTSTLDQGLGLSGIIANILLGELGGLLRLLLGNSADLRGLGIDDVAGLLELLVDELLVGGVDKGRKEDDGGGNQCKAPGGDDLDKIVREESTEGNLKTVSKGLKSQLRDVRDPRKNKSGILTATEAARFSTNKIRWASMTKKLMSSLTSPITASRVSLEIV